MLVLLDTTHFLQVSLRNTGWTSYKYGELP
jgi:hypothetical protein